MDIYTFQLSKWRKVKAQGVKIIDTTVRSGYAQVAPTWDMVTGSKDDSLSEQEYTRQYLDMMNDSRKANPAFWRALFRLENMALGCYCQPGKFCHRHLLKDYILQHTTATYKGEIV